jgi:hypothetical protein
LTRHRTVATAATEDSCNRALLQQSTAATEELLQQSTAATEELLQQTAATAARDPP